MKLIALLTTVGNEGVAGNLGKLKILGEIYCTKDFFS